MPGQPSLAPCPTFTQQLMDPSCLLCRRLTVEMADRLVQSETSGTLLQRGAFDIRFAACVAASCAMVARCCPLSPADSSRVAATAAIALGSGRTVLQGLAMLPGTTIPHVKGAMSDLLDNMRYSVLLALHHGVMGPFARDVAPPSRLLGWMQDAAAVLNRLCSLDRAGEVD